MDVSLSLSLSHTHTHTHTCIQYNGHFTTVAAKSPGSPEDSVDLPTYVSSSVTLGEGGVRSNKLMFSCVVGSRGQAGDD